MGTLADYFDKVSYKPKYYLGDRVYGKFNKIPFIGTIGNDRCIDGVNKEVLIHVDLPIKHQGKIYNLIKVKHKDITGYLKPM